MKNIWIMNHYATEMFRNKAGRHYWFADKLLEKGYNLQFFVLTPIISIMII